MLGPVVVLAPRRVSDACCRLYALATPEGILAQVLRLRSSRPLKSAWSAARLLRLRVPPLCALLVE